MRDKSAGPDLDAVPFTSLYLTDREWAAEIVNRTVHGVMHIGWVPDVGGGYHGQMSVYVKRNGLLGSAYMTAIAPFRYVIVYPLMLGRIGREWRAHRRAAHVGVMIRPTTPAAGTRAERIEVGPRALSRLPGADYADAFRIGSRTGQTAEQWARRLFESGPSGPRRLFSLIIWQGLLGLRLAPPDSPGHIAGWALAENEPDLLVMRAESRLMVGRMVFEVSDEHITWTTLLRFERAVARPVWAVTGNGHRALAPMVLTRACR